MPKMVTGEQLDELEKKMLAHLTPNVDKPGLHGTIARCMVAALPKLARWSADEYNRETPPSETLEALATVAANTLCSELDNLNVDIDVKVAAVNEFLHVLAEKTHRLMTNKTPGTFHQMPAQEVGHG